MKEWLDIRDIKPEEEQNVFYYFEVFDRVYRGKYRRIQYPEELFGEGEDPVYGDMFYGDDGFLTDDVMFWMTDDGEEKLPDSPFHDQRYEEEYGEQ